MKPNSDDKPVTIGKVEIDSAVTARGRADTFISDTLGRALETGMLEAARIADKLIKTAGVSLAGLEESELVSAACAAAAKCPHAAEDRRVTGVQFEYSAAGGRRVWIHLGCASLECPELAVSLVDGEVRTVRLAVARHVEPMLVPAKPVGYQAVDARAFDGIDRGVMPGYLAAWHGDQPGRIEDAAAHVAAASLAAGPFDHMLDAVEYAAQYQQRPVPRDPRVRMLAQAKGITEEEAERRIQRVDRALAGPPAPAAPRAFWSTETLSGARETALDKHRRSRCFEHQVYRLGSPGAYREGIAMMHLVTFDAPWVFECRLCTTQLSVEERELPLHLRQAVYPLREVVQRERDHLELVSALERQIATSARANKELTQRLAGFNRAVVIAFARWVDAVDDAITAAGAPNAIEAAQVVELARGRLVDEVDRWLDGGDSNTWWAVEGQRLGEMLVARRRARLEAAWRDEEERTREFVFDRELVLCSRQVREQLTSEQWTEQVAAGVAALAAPGPAVHVAGDDPDDVGVDVPDHEAPIR